MTRKLLLVAVMVLPLGVQAQSLQKALRHFDEGTARLQAGSYTEAVQAFDNALASGHASAALHYNRGVALYRMDRIGEAIASFERARRLDPDHRQALHNLDFARTRIQDQMSQLPRTLSQALWGWLDRAFGPMVLFLVGLTGYWAWTLIVGMRLLGRPYSDWTRRAAWISLGVGVMGLALGFGVSLKPADPPAAVVVAQEASVYPDASGTASPETEIHEGLTVTVISRSGDWTAVQLPNGTTGWVASSTLINV